MCNGKVASYLRISFCKIGADDDPIMSMLKKSFANHFLLIEAQNGINYKSKIPLSGI